MEETTLTTEGDTVKTSLPREYALFLFFLWVLPAGLARGQNSLSPSLQKNPPAVLQPDGCSLVPGTLRDNFNRPDAALPGTNKWSLIQNQPSGGSMAIVNNALRPTSSAGAYNFGGVVWDTLVGGGTEASLSVLQKSGNTSYTSLFLYARMNNKDYASGTGYRLRFFQQSGSDLIEIDRVGPGYAVFTSLARTTHTITPGDVITFRVLCDNRTMVALTNGVQLLSVSDTMYSPPQWYFAIRSCVFPTPVVFDNFSVSSQSGGPVLPPPAPTLLSPANGAANQSTSPTLTWNPSSGAVSYRLQVATDSLFGSLILDDSAITATSRQLSSLSNSKRYFWRVKAKNGSGTSPYSAQWGFTTIAPGTAIIRHLEYVFPDGWINVYDIDSGHALVKSISVPTATGTRGAVVSPSDGMLYISYGGDGGQYGNGSLLQYDLIHDRLGWNRHYTHGIDSHAISPDGTTIYLPDGELSADGKWYVVNTSDGSEKGVITTGGYGPHNTVVSLDGSRVYLGDRDINNAGNDSLYVASTTTYQVIKKAGKFMSGIRPFTINGTETFAFVTITGLLGFQVCNLTTGQVVYTVDLTTMGWSKTTCGSGCASAPSHGISLSPDEKEIYIIDQPNSYVHVFDVSGISRNIAPVKLADIRLQNPMSGNESGCAYDCLKDGWIHHSLDGRFVYVGDAGDVINTSTRTTVATLPALKNTRKMLEIDWQNGRPVATSTREGLGYVVSRTTPLPPTPVSPSNGALNQPTTVTVSWNASGGAASYRLQVSLNSSFSTTVLDQSGITTTSRTVNNLSTNTAYYWRVSAMNASGTSAYSGTWSWTTANGAPSASDLWVAQEGLASPWINASWAATVDFASRERQFSGVTSVKVIQGKWGGLSVHSGGWAIPIDVRPSAYKSLDFAIYTPSIGLSLKVQLQNDQGSAFPLISSWDVPVNQWIVVSLPMSQLNPLNLVVHRINFMDISGATTTYFLDELHFVGASAAATALTKEDFSGGSLPAKFVLYQNYPNPFNPTTRISFALPEPSMVRLSVFNILGQKVATPVNGELGAGYHSIEWSASQDNGAALPSGLYFYRIHARSSAAEKEFTETRRMLLTR